MSSRAKPQPTQRHRQPKSAPYFSREETNTFRLTPIIPPSSKTWRWDKNRDPLLRSARGRHALIHRRKSSFNAAMAAGVTKNRVARKYHPSPEDDYFSSCQNWKAHALRLGGAEKLFCFFFIVAISKLLIRQQRISRKARPLIVTTVLLLI